MDGPLALDSGTDHADPVRRLLSLGEPADYDPANWPDYLAGSGLGPQHIDALIRLACDEDLNEADPDTPEVWAPLHAWRALGQLRAEEAVGPLLSMLAFLEDDNSADLELPAVFGMIGPAALPQLAGYAADPSNPTYPSATALNGIKEIAKLHPASRAACVDALVRMLAPGGRRDRYLAGFAVSALLDLRAVEAIDVMRDAFRRDVIEPSVAGDVEDIEIELGLRQRRATEPRYSLLHALQPALPRPDRTIEVVPRREKVGRNDPCPCGSGKKYKKCCLH